MTPSPSSADADRDFLLRRSHQVRHSNRYRAVVGVVVLGLLFIAVIGAVVGGPQQYVDLDAAVRRQVAAGKLDEQRGGSVCAGWPAALMGPKSPAEVAPDKVVVYLSLKGWHVHVGADLDAAGAQVILEAADGRPRVAADEPPGFQVTSDESDRMVVVASPGPPSDSAGLTTTCGATTMTVEAVDAQGEPLPPGTIVYPGGVPIGQNPVTFTR